MINNLKIFAFRKQLRFYRYHIECWIVQLISLKVISVPLSNMTHAAPSFPFFPLWQQTQHHRERRSGCHIWNGYRDYKSVGIWFSDVCSLKLVFRVLFTVFSILIYLKWILIKPRMTVLSTGQTSRLSSTQIIPITDFSITLIETPTNIIISGL